MKRFVFLLLALLPFLASAKPTYTATEIYAPWSVEELMWDTSGEPKTFAEMANFCNTEFSPTSAKYAYRCKGIGRSGSTTWEFDTYAYGQYTCPSGYVRRTSHVVEPERPIPLHL